MKKILKIFTGFIISIIILSYNSINLAANLSELKDKQNDVKEEISATEDELDEISGEKSAALEEVESLITKISEAQKEIDELNDKIESLETKISDAEKQIAQDEEDYKTQKSNLDARLVAMYKSGDTSYLDFLLSSSDLSDFISSYQLISEVAEYDTKMLEELAEHKEKIQNQKTELENNKVEVENSKKSVEAKKAALETTKKEKNAKVANLTAKEQEQEEKLQDLQDANDDLNKEIKKAQAAIEAAKKAASAKSSSGSSGSSSASTKVSSSGFIWPVSTKYSITTGWYYSSGKVHGGVDFSGSGIGGSPIYAVADGYVVTSKALIRNGRYYSYGNYVLIAHYNGLYTLYAHMSSRNVSAGQTVSQGQVIGYVGSTGNSTGNHLHFEVRTGSGSSSERVYPGSYITK